jgi:hypothetical protein
MSSPLQQEHSHDPDLTSDALYSTCQEMVLSAGMRAVFFSLVLLLSIVSVV